MGALRTTRYLGRGGARATRWAWLCSLAALAAIATSAVAAPGALATGDATNPACPPETEASPGFRTYLPDCRAFELVSPAYAGGQPPYGLASGPTPLISPDGAHVLSFDFAGLAGAENLEESRTDYVGVYEFSRTPSGWSAEALDPPAVQYPRSRLAVEAGVASASTNLDRTLWELDARPGGAPEAEFERNAATLAIREPAGGGKGKFTLLGAGVFDPSYDPEGGSFGIVGASSDLGHVLLRVSASPHTSWPGDETAEADPSLYEYQDREGQEPVLVGVSNAGPLTGATHVNEHAQLVSECGTSLDGNSQSGEVVLFTAEHQGGCSARQPAASELDARVHGEKTIEISEPPLSGPEAIPGRQCTGECAEAEEDSPQPATYDGSTADATTVYFTSEQPLLDTATGGGPYLYEETITDEGEASHATALKLIAAPVTAVPALAKDGTRIYFESSAVLTSGANANGEHAGEQPGAANLYTYTPVGAGSLRFVAEEPSGSQENGADTYASLDTTADGEYLLFESSRQLKGTGDTSTAPDRQLFEYSAASERVTRISAGDPAPGGAECEIDQSTQPDYGCDGNGSTINFAPHMVLAPGSSLAEDGTVVFSSTLALTPQAAPSRFLANSFGGIETRSENVYEYRNGALQLISPGDEAASVHQPTLGDIRLYGITPGGGDVLFGTAENLLPQDLDSQYSWYDARADGGYPAPPAAAECSGSACEAPGAPPPSFTAPASSTEAAGANVTSAATSAPPPSKAAPKAPAKCRKGHVRHHGKCIRIKHKRGGRANKSTVPARGKGARR